MCPGCGRKFTHPHHAGVAEDWAEFIGVQFKSKQTGRWGLLRVPIELVFWGDTRAEAWSAEEQQRPRSHGEAMARMAARITDTLELTYGAASATAPERAQQCAESTTALSTGRIAPQTRTSCLRT